MRTWGWVLALCGWLACLKAGVFALFTALAPAGPATILQIHLPAFTAFAKDHVGFFWMVGTALLLVATLALASVLGRWFSSNHLSFAGEHGRVLVDAATIEECLRKVLADEEGVARSRVALRAGRTQLDCQVLVWLEAGADVVERVRQIQARLQEYYASVLPGGVPLRVEVCARLIYRERPGRGSARPGAAARPADRGADESYGGPRYPVDGSDADPGGLTSC